MLASDSEYVINETLYEELDAITFPVISEDADSEGEDANNFDCNCDMSERSLCTLASHISCHSSDVSCYLCDRRQEMDFYYQSASDAYQTPSSRTPNSQTPNYYHKLRMEKFLIMGFKKHDANFVSVFEDNWKDMTGARSVLLNLSAEYGLSKIKFLKRVNDAKSLLDARRSPDQDLAPFTHLLVVTLKHVTRKNKIYLMDFIHRLRLRMLGSLALYGHHDSFDPAKDGSSACFTASSRSNSCTHSSASYRLPSLIRNHSLASSIRRKRFGRSSLASSFCSESSSNSSDKRSLRSSIL